ncbi:MAG: hypothetical protein Q8Q54_12320 [Methylococcales bacterium]|nr:hypothetical protein [Methylococcales bacterium]MDP3839694.1 hypothetical protein [Methylococcales bacterium]
MFDWLKKSKNEKQAGIATEVKNIKEQSSVKVQNVNNSTAENITCAETIIDSFKTEIHHHHYAKSESKLMSLDSTSEVDLYHLPKPTTALIGRKTELAQLTEAIKNPNKRLAIIVAAGGIGKSALTDEWLTQISKENYYGKTRVFGWSFYSQGSHNTFTNSQPFFSAVLPFLGVTELPDEIKKDEIKKARLLVEKLCEYPCLLILDGLEPLQYAENLQSMNGELQDSALKEFIACFRQTAGKSFVLLSSRQPLVELKKWQAEHYLSLDLQTLPHQDGADLLQALGVTGKAAERQAISQDLNGHALSLVLFGHLLSEHHQGDCRYAKELPPLTSAHGDSDAEKDSRHALRVLDYYDSLQDAASRCFLQLLGLFDRPMNSAEKAVLIANAKHAEPLRALTDLEWKKVEQRLEKSGLLLGKKGTFERLEWDTHPIIRAYFGEKFKENHLENFKQAHLVLFDYYQKLPEKEFPDTLDEMLPLYRAVVHGCLAGKHREALFDIFDKRIQRGKKNYSAFNLGAYIQNITALSLFNWQKLEQYDLKKAEQIWLLKHISHFFTSLARLQDAAEIALISFKLAKELENWQDASGIARGLVNLYQPRGELLKALPIAEEGAKYSRFYKLGESQKDDIFEQTLNDCRLASILHLSGNLRDAEQYCKNIEKLWKNEGNGFLYLITVPAFRYCNILLDSTSNNEFLYEIIKRGEYILEKHIVPSGAGLAVQLDQAFGKFIIAQSYFSLNDYANATVYFDQAIKAIEDANRIEYTPQFYLARADFYLTQNQLAPALTDLNSAWEIIERCGMKLYQVDYLLIHGRYSLATADFDTALNHYQEAKQLIEETGYHLRDAELDLFAAQICLNSESKLMSLDSKNADYYLQKAKTRIAEIGQWGLMRVIERDFPNQA